ncbi:NADH--cytochrome b5 reductase 1 [Linum grandiflorum]
MDLVDYLQTLDPQILLGVAVAIVAIGIGAIFLLSPKKSRGCLDPENFKEFKLVKRSQLSHNVAKFTFALPTPTSVLGLPIGQHISCRGKDSVGEEVTKPYTPTTLDSDVGHFELVIKMYPQGRMSHHFREMRVGDSLSVKGPKVHKFISIVQMMSQNSLFSKQVSNFLWCRSCHMSRCISITRVVGIRFRVVYSIH